MGITGTNQAHELDGARREMERRRKQVVRDFVGRMWSGWTVLLDKTNR